MKSCFLYGTTDLKDLDPNVKAVLVTIFDAFIRLKDVKLFITTSKTDFDKYCETLLYTMKKKIHNDIILIEIRDENTYRYSKESMADFELPFKFDNYIEQCSCAAKISDFIIMDYFEKDGIRDKIISNAALYRLSKNLEKPDLFTIDNIIV